MGADPVAFRREFGRELLLMGGFEKNALKTGAEGIDAEFNRQGPLVDEGGFVPFGDRRVPPVAPYSEHLSDLRRSRCVWGKDSSLEPVAPDLDTSSEM